MARTTTKSSSDPQIFPQFPKLPLELRCQIWSLVTIRRPRVIQVTYDPDKKTWGACKDGCGGLPSTIHICHESRDEALKPYTKAFDTFIDFNADTIYVSDPIFAIRGPREDFFRSEHISKIRKFALNSDIYRGLSDSHDHFPSYCDSPPAVLRKLESLDHFTLVAASDDNDSIVESDDDDLGLEDYDDDFINLDDDEVEDGNGTGQQMTAREGTANILGDIRAAEERIRLLDKRLLDKLDAQAMTTMSKGYFRERGNIHFEPDMNRWGSWDYHMDVVMTACWRERQLSPWIRPKFNVMVVKYGLQPLDDFAEIYHDMGDYSEGIMTYKEALKFLDLDPNTTSHFEELASRDGMDIKFDDLWKTIHAIRSIALEEDSYELKWAAVPCVARAIFGLDDNTEFIM